MAFERTGSTEKCSDKTINIKQTTETTERSPLLQFFRVHSLGGSVRLYQIRITTETEWRIGDTDYRKVNRCILFFQFFEFSGLLMSDVLVFEFLTFI